VIREADDLRSTYEPAKLRAGLLSPEKGDRIFETIYRGREEGIHPITRPCATSSIPTGCSLPLSGYPALLDDAARAPIMRERHGERFRLSRDEDIAYEPNPEGVRAMLAATAGS
jgi:hypothetical protein